MTTFTASDGTRLSYDDSGSGAPLVAVGGGPMQDSVYLGDLGGLPRSARLIRHDWRGTGASAVPADPGTYRADRLVDDLDALRRHLRVDTLDLLAHCAGANVAVRYVERHPQRVERLVLVTPSTRALGIDATSDDRRAVTQRRAGEPWYPPAAAAFERIQRDAAEEGDWDAITPFTFGRWDDAARAHHAAEEHQSHAEAAQAFGAEGAFDPPATRAALAAFERSVLVLAGEWDVAAPPAVLRQVAGLFPHATFAVQRRAGHYPWLDDADAFTSVVAPFLAPRSP